MLQLTVCRLGFRRTVGQSRKEARGPAEVRLTRHRAKSLALRARPSCGMSDLKCLAPLDLEVKGSLSRSPVARLRRYQVDICLTLTLDLYHVDLPLRAIVYIGVA